MTKQDALSAFLSADLDIKDTVHIDRLNIDLEVKALDTPTFKRLNDQADFGGVVDEMRLNGLMISAACVNVPFGDPKMLEKYDASDAGDCVQKALLPGELVSVTQKIMKLSGFDNLAELVKQAKN